MDLCKAKDTEINLIAKMTRQLFEDEPSDKNLSNEQYEKRLREYMNNGCDAFLFLDENVIGYALVNLVRTPCYLIDFYICRDYRRKGRGTAAFELLMRELKAESIDLDVFCWNDRGRKFWESLGFKERAIIMRKEYF